MQFLARLHKFDRQLVLTYSHINQRWLLFRQPEKYGEPSRDLTYPETMNRASAGIMYYIMALESEAGSRAEPGDWVIDELRRRDLRRTNWKAVARDLDETFLRTKAQMSEKLSERLDYRINQDWEHIRDELRGDTSFRKYTISK
jgi:hypothetical protein